MPPSTDDLEFLVAETFLLQEGGDRFGAIQGELLVELRVPRLVGLSNHANLKARMALETLCLRLQPSLSFRGNLHAAGLKFDGVWRSAFQAFGPLAIRGFCGNEVRGILGESFRRVASVAWAATLP